MGKPVVVFGSFNADLTSRSPGLPTPGQTILGSSFHIGAGGKGSNQAVAAHRAGADMVFITKLGKDIFADVALTLYTREGMDTAYILSDDRYATGCAVIMVDEITAQNEIVVVPGACNHFTPEDLEKCRPIIENASILLVQLETEFEALYTVIRMAHKAGAQIVLNPAPAAELPADILKMVDIITPNETEAEMLTGICVKTKEDAQMAAARFREMGIEKTVITMGSLGAFASDGERSEMVPRLSVKAVDTTGAGDAFNGAFVTALSEGKDLFEALRFGNAAGALSVTGLGAADAMPTREKIDAMVASAYGNGQ